MFSRITTVLTAAVLAASCVAGNPTSNGPPGDKPDAGEEIIPIEGGSIQIEPCGYPVVTTYGATAPVKGSNVLGPDPEPYHMHLGIAGPATTSMVVQWATRDQTTLATTVQYGKASVSEKSQDGITFQYLTGFGSNGDMVRVHETHLCGLEPATTYKYRVGGVGEGGAEKWSPEYTFRTAPDLVADPSAQVTILVLGDTRDGYDTWGKLLAKGHDDLAPEADLILFTGDAVTFGQLQDQWDAFLEAGEPVLRLVPMLAAHGNHDSNSINYLSLMAQPGQEQTFGLDYGPLHLTVLNDSPDDTADIGGKQLAFLTADLAAHTDAPWKIVLHHKPLWSAAANHGSDADLQSKWGPVYDANHVDLVLNGHDHNYERSKPMFGPTPKATPAEGTIYVVAGSAGAELYDPGVGFWTEVSAKTQNMAVFKIRVGELKMTAYDPDGTKIDELSIAK
jgi:hypothetical protein